MGAVKFYTSLIFIVLFSFALITTQTKFNEDNGGTDLDDTDGKNSLLSLNDTVREWETDANTSLVTFVESSTEGDSDTTKTGSQFKVGVGSAVGGTTDASNSAFKWVFGSDGVGSTFFFALSSMLVFAAAAFGWAAWRGNVE